MRHTPTAWQMGMEISRCTDITGTVEQNFEWIRGANLGGGWGNAIPLKNLEIEVLGNVISSAAVLRDICFIFIALKL